MIVTELESCLENASLNPTDEFLSQKAIEIRCSMVKCLSTFIPEINLVHEDLQACINVATNLDTSLSGYLV